MIGRHLSRDDTSAIGSAETLLAEAMARRQGQMIAIRGIGQPRWEIQLGFDDSWVTLCEVMPGHPPMPLTRINYSNERNGDDYDRCID